MSVDDLYADSAYVNALRDELRDKSNDLLDVRGILSPNGEQPKTPLSLVPTVAPAVAWLVAEVERLGNDVYRLTAVLDQAEEHVEERDQRNADLAADLVEIQAQRREAQAEVSRLRVELEATQDDRDEARHALRECGRELKAAEQRLESIRVEGLERGP